MPARATGAGAGGGGGALASAAQPSALEQRLEAIMVHVLLAAMLAYLFAQCWAMRGARFVRGDGDAAAAAAAARRSAERED